MAMQRRVTQKLPTRRRRLWYKMLPGRRLYDRLIMPRWDNMEDVRAPKYCPHCNRSEQ